MRSSAATPAISLTTAECGPATLTTTGASMDSPPASVTPVTRPPARSIAITRLAEAEHGAVVAGGVGEVVGGQHRVVDVPALLLEERA